MPSTLVILFGMYLLNCWAVILTLKRTLIAQTIQCDPKRCEYGEASHSDWCVSVKRKLQEEGSEKDWIDSNENNAADVFTKELISQQITMRKMMESNNVDSRPIRKAKRKTNNGMSWRNVTRIRLLGRVVKNFAALKALIRPHRYAIFRSS